MRSTRDLVPDAVTAGLALRDRTVRSLAGEWSHDGGTNLVGRVRRRTADAVRTTAFWGAVVLPFAHGPLVLDGLGTAGEASVALGLLALNAFALLVGHCHRQPGAP